MTNAVLGLTNKAFREEADWPPKSLQGLIGRAGRPVDPGASTGLDRLTVLLNPSGYCLHADRVHVVPGLVLRLLTSALR